MKNLFSLMLVAFATLTIACGGNANRAQTATEETVEVVAEETTDACCEGEEACCEGEECTEKCAEEKVAAAE